MKGKARLVLRMLRAPAGVTIASREVESSRFCIGRSVNNDWTLPDPNKALSKRHCVLEAHGDAWFVTDLSSNGTSINGRLLQPRTPRALEDGYLLSVGPYEFETRFDTHPSWTLKDRGLSEAQAEHDFFDDRLTSDPFPVADGDALEAAEPAVGLPGDFDLTGSKDMLSPFAETVSNHVSDLNQNFRPPRGGFEVLPEDWDAGIEPPSPAKQPHSAGSAEVPTSATSTVPGPAAKNPMAPTERGGSRTGFAAFAAGAGLTGSSVDDEGATLHGLGAAFREMVGGLRRALIARAMIKGELRIDQTMIRARGNNPLKFSADDDDALSALLGTGRRTGMTPRQAIAESLRDMRLHELAVASAMQRAVRDVLEAFDPAPVWQQTKGSFFSGLFNQRQRRAWDAHCQRYAKTVTALSDDFDSVFGKSFVRAYETALSELASQDRDAEDAADIP